MQKIQDTQSAQVSQHRTVLNQLLCELNREEVYYQALLQIQSLIPSELAEELALYRYIKISKPLPLDAKFSIPSPKEIKFEPVDLPESPICSLSDSDGVPAICEIRILNNNIAHIYQLHRAYEAIEIYFDKLNLTISFLQKQLVRLHKAQNLSDSVIALAKEAQKMPRPNEHAVRAIYLTAKAKQKIPCTAAALTVLQQIIKNMEAALQIAPSIAPLPARNSLLELKLLPMVIPPIQVEEKKRQEEGVAIKTWILDWEALMYVNRTITLILKKSNYFKGLEGWMEFRDYMFNVHLKYPSGPTSSIEPKEALRLLDSALSSDHSWVADKEKQMKRAVKEEVEAAQSLYQEDYLYFSWEALSRFNVLVRSLQEAYKRRWIGWTSVGRGGRPDLQEPFISESYYFTDWFNESKSHPECERGYPDYKQPFYFTRNVAGLNRIHRDLYKFIDGLQDLNIHLEVISGNQASAYLADFPEISVCMHAFRSMMASRLRELREDYALIYGEYQNRQLVYQALEKEYAQVCGAEVQMPRQITQGLGKNLNREKACATALSQIGIFTQRSQDQAVKEIKAYMLAIAPSNPVISFGGEAKAVSVSALSPLFSSSIQEISLPVMVLLEWAALNKIYDALYKREHQYYTRSPIVSSLEKLAYWPFQGVFKEIDRQVLLKMIHDFGHYFSGAAAQDDKQLAQANIALTNLIDRIDYSPNLADFVNDVKNLYEYFLALYDQEINITLREVQAKCRKLQARNASLAKDIETLKACIVTKQSVISSEAWLCSRATEAVTMARDLRPQESSLLVVGFLVEQARRRGATLETHAILDDIASEVRKVLR